MTPGVGPSGVRSSTCATPKVVGRLDELVDWQRGYTPSHGPSSGGGPLCAACHDVKREVASVCLSHAKRAARATIAALAA